MACTDFTDAASRLCLACGMCCNGVLFHIVRLQPGDSAGELEALGVKLRRRKREPYFKQPCDFLQDCTCRIYAQRPVRCRLFECKQLKQLANEEITEIESLRTIEEVKTSVAEVESLLEKAGNTEAAAPLFERCAKILENEMSADARASLQTAVLRLHEMLNAKFRLVPVWPPISHS